MKSKGLFESKCTFTPSGVEAMAARREKRVSEQRELLRGGGEERAVVCIGMNIAGPIKRSGLIDAAFLDAVRCFLREKYMLENSKAEEKPRLELRFINENTGIEALFAFDEGAKKLKTDCVEIEENHPAGRLFDMDVIEKNGAKLNRSTPRKCLICSENAAVCARSRAHTVAELQGKTTELLIDFVSEALADAAKNALIAEVNATPKPGLVDGNNSGANPDMDLPMFHRSADALRPYFAQMAKNALEFAVERAAARQIGLQEFIKKLRSIGIEAESAMLSATGGVNTHRGAVYSLGLLVCAAAIEIERGVFAANESGLEGSIAEGYSFSECCAKNAAKLASLLGDGSHPSSNGAKVREKYGVSGPVQQAQRGFPLAMLAKSKKAEYYNKYKAKCGADELVGLAWAYALLSVMALLEDNNALKRGGEEGAAYVKMRASELTALAECSEPEAFREELLKFDLELIDMNISCGGAADMLALALFLDGIEERYAPVLALLACAKRENED